MFGTGSGWYWSSSTYVGYPAYAWYIGFYDSNIAGGVDNVSADDRGDHHYVHTVRG